MRILVLCTHNSARSQMAEGWLRRHASDAGLDAEVVSAGTVATFVKPEAAWAMGEVGIDLSGHHSKTIEDVIDTGRFDVVLTVCDAANEACPIFPGARVRLHVSFRDPSGGALDDWREVRDEIGATSRRLIAKLAAGQTPSSEEITTDKEVE